MMPLTGTTSGEGAPQVRPADVASLALVALAGLVGLLAAPSLPATLQVHWTIGDLPYRGVEQLSKPGALAVVPLLGLGVYAILRSLTLVDPVRTALAEVRGLYDAVLVATVGSVVLAQVLLVVLNL